jgi:DNA-binding PadR family transcriptional regulator
MFETENSLLKKVETIQNERDKLKQKIEKLEPKINKLESKNKDLKEKGLLSTDENKRYSLTKKGQEELETHLNIFFNTFCDIEEMR